MERPREIPFHESANRPQLLMGGDRELILVSAILAAMLVFAVMKWWSILAGLILCPGIGDPLQGGRAHSVADRGWGFRAHGKSGPPLASCLYPAHSLSEFLPRQESAFRSSHYHSCELEMKHVPY